MIDANETSGDFQRRRRAMGGRMLESAGLVSQGKTRDEAVSHIREAIRLYLTVLEEDHLPFPEDRLDTLLVEV